MSAKTITPEFDFSNIHGFHSQHKRIFETNRALIALSKKIRKPLRQLFALEVGTEVGGVVSYLSDTQGAIPVGAIAFEDPEYLNVLATTDYSAGWGVGKNNVLMPPGLAEGDVFKAVVEDLNFVVAIIPHRALTWVSYKQEV